jgi:hypothetical protein
VFREAVFREAVFREAVFREAVFREAVFREAVFREAVFREAVFREAVFQSLREAGGGPGRRKPMPALLFGYGCSSRFPGGRWSGERGQPKRRLVASGTAKIASVSADQAILKDVDSIQWAAEDPGNNVVTASALSFRPSRPTTTNAQVSR